MGAVGDTYGSERHLLTYRRDDPQALDRAMLRSLERDEALTSLQWLYPDQTGRRGAEFKGIGFLRRGPNPLNSPRALAEWAHFWPTRGSAPSWDGVGVLHEAAVPEQWVLVEAKANHPEFVGAPTRASGKGLQQIQRALNLTKRRLGVHRHFDWTGSYYQSANRLAVVSFLNRHGAPASLVEVFFIGDRFPDGRACPETHADWQPLLEARRLTLGLPRLTLEHGVADVFLPVPVR
jgi:hypothetical protein